MTDLIERIEALEGPDRDIDAEIGRYFASDFLGKIPDESQQGCAQFTTSIDTAITLVDSDNTANYLRLAVNECIAKYGHGKSFLEALPRFICIAALKARSD